MWLITLGADASGSGFIGFNLFSSWFQLVLWLWLCFYVVFLKYVCIPYVFPDLRALLDDVSLGFFCSSIYTGARSRRWPLWPLCPVAVYAIEGFMAIMWFILTVIMLVVDFSIAWLCFLASLSVYPGLRFLGLVTCFFQWLDLVFTSACFFIPFSHPSYALCFSIFPGVFFLSFRWLFCIWYLSMISTVFPSICCLLLCCLLFGSFLLFPQSFLSALYFLYLFRFWLAWTPFRSVV